MPKSKASIKNMEETIRTRTFINTRFFSTLHQVKSSHERAHNIH